MDMSNGSADPSIADLPLSDPKCNTNDCIAFLDAGTASQEQIPWAYLFEYGHWATWYYLIVIFVLMIFYIQRSLQDRYVSPTSTAQRPTIWQKIVALGRYISYRHATGQKASWLGLPSGGMLTFLIATTLVLSLLIFAVHPYYRDHEDYGSPPLAIRSGLIAFACTPILIALAGKANVVTLLTGISHEHLNVVHQWVAWLSLGLSLAHSLPFFIQSYQEGPFLGVSGSENVATQFYAYGNTMADEYNGAPPLAVLFALCITSLPPIRRRFYESFYFVHILLGITYLGTLFWHSFDTLDSWAYLWATLALWLASYFARLFWYTQPLSLKNQWFTTSPTTMTPLPGGMTKMDVLAPPGFSFTPGQHVFLRFPSISFFDNHPFTIASAPSVTPDRDHAESLAFLVRSHAGFTRTIANHCSSEPDNLATSWIDGPYGGFNRPAERLYNNIVLVAGGTGISACLPWLQHIVNHAAVSLATAANNFTVSRVKVIWAMKQAEHFTWVGKQIEELAAVKQSKVTIELEFYLTGSHPPSTQIEVDSRSESERDESGRNIGINDDKGGTIAESITHESSSYTSMANIGTIRSGRPIVKTALGDAFAAYEGRTLVLGCGPESMKGELSNACADAQMHVLRGRCSEVALYTEAFGW